MFESISAALGERRKNNGVLETTFSKNYLKTINALTRSYTASHAPAYGNLVNNLNANDWIIEPDKPQVSNGAVVRLSTLKLLEAQEYIQSC